MGTGRSCGHRSVFAGDPVSGRICSPVRMLLRSSQSEPEEEDVQAGWGDLDVCEDVCDLYTVK